MNCPACKPNLPCGACSVEKEAKRGRGRPRLGFDAVPVTIRVHPDFLKILDAAATRISQGEAVERAFGFKRGDK